MRRLTSSSEFRVPSSELKRAALDVLETRDAQPDQTRARQRVECGDSSPLSGVVPTAERERGLAIARPEQSGDKSPHSKRSATINASESP